SSTHSSDLSPSSQTISSHLLPFANPSSFDMDRHHDHTFYNPSSQRRRSIEYSPDEQDYDDTGGFYGPPSTTDMHHHDPFIDPSKYSQSHRDIHDNITQSHPDTSSGGFPAFTSSSSSSSTSARHLARHDPLSMTSGYFSFLASLQANLKRSLPAPIIEESDSTGIEEKDEEEEENTTGSEEREREREREREEEIQGIDDTGFLQTSSRVISGFDEELEQVGQGQGQEEPQSTRRSEFAGEFVKDEEDEEMQGEFYDNELKEEDRIDDKSFQRASPMHPHSQPTEKQEHDKVGVELEDVNALDICDNGLDMPNPYEEEYKYKTDEPISQPSARTSVRSATTFTSPEATRTMKSSSSGINPKDSHSQPTEMYIHIDETNFNNGYYSRFFSELGLLGSGSFGTPISQPSARTSVRSATTFTSPEATRTMKSSSSGINPKDSHSQPTEMYIHIDETNFNNGYYSRFFSELGLLGSGSFGTVNLCSHHLNGIELGLYAVKKLACGESERFLNETLLEAKLLQQCRHPNVLGYIHVWLERMVPTAINIKSECPPIPHVLILLEYADLGSFHDLIGYLFDDDIEEEMDVCERKEKRERKKKKRKLKKRIDELIEEKNSILQYKQEEEEKKNKRYFYFSGLNYLHSRLCLLHRDLKPSNVMISSKEGAAERRRRRRRRISRGREGRGGRGGRGGRDEEEDQEGLDSSSCTSDVLIPIFSNSLLVNSRALLADMGQCKDIACAQMDTRSGRTGTVDYRAPELTRGVGKSSIQSDIWSMGASIYAVLLGHAPLKIEQHHYPYSSSYSDALHPSTTVSSSTDNALYIRELGIDISVNMDKLDSIISSCDEYVKLSSHSEYDYYPKSSKERKEFHGGLYVPGILSHSIFISLDDIIPLRRLCILLKRCLHAIPSKRPPLSSILMEFDEMK
ncbi:hypothetical protein ADUPG1_010068, partial [Aduncisulcus paluster]